MKAVWVDSMQDADWSKAQKHKLTALFYPITDPVEDVKRRVQDTKAHNCASGVYMAWNWPQFVGLGGANMADLMHSMVASVEQGGIAVKVQFDIEAHEPALILACCSRWRSLRPKQDTSWTMEGHQGGWMTGTFVSDMTRLRIRVVPQLYNGAMTEHYDSLYCVRDLTSRGFPDSMVSPFYDAARVEGLFGWSGYAFTQNRLP